MNRRRSRITHIDRVGLVICGIYVERMVSFFLCYSCYATIDDGRSLLEKVGPRDTYEYM